MSFKIDILVVRKAKFGEVIYFRDLKHCLL